ncbi:MAG: Cys-Gln thioester bond-forming surface protein [Buchananella hordeovulneris]|nr:Cys-Gln thioester bond-forming surface protein [Buchananella hordeovulneris]
MGTPPGLARVVPAVRRRWSGWIAATLIALGMGPLWAGPAHAWVPGAGVAAWAAGPVGAQSAWGPGVGAAGETWSLLARPAGGNYRVQPGIEGIKVLIPGDGHVRAGLATLTGPDGSAVRAYCIDLVAWLGSNYQRSADHGEIMRRHGPQIRAILERSYPRYAPAQVAKRYGVALPKADPARLSQLTASATQVAIWNFVHGFRYGGVEPGTPADQEAYVRLLAAALVADSIANPSAPALIATIHSPAAAPPQKVGEFWVVGPFHVSRAGGPQGVNPKAKLVALAGQGIELSVDALAVLSVDANQAGIIPTDLWREINGYRSPTRPEERLNLLENQGQQRGNAGDEASREGESTGQGPEAAGRAADASGQGLEEGGRAVDVSGLGVGSAGRGVDASGQGLGSAGRGVEASGPGTDALGREVGLASQEEIPQLPAAPASRELLRGNINYNAGFYVAVAHESQVEPDGPPNLSFTLEAKPVTGEVATGAVLVQPGHQSLVVAEFVPQAGKSGKAAVSWQRPQLPKPTPPAPTPPAATPTPTPVPPTCPPTPPCPVPPPTCPPAPPTCEPPSAPSPASSPTPTPACPQPPVAPPSCPPAPCVTATPAPVPSTVPTPMPSTCPPSAPPQSTAPPSAGPAPTPQPTISGTPAPTPAPVSTPTAPASSDSSASSTPTAPPSVTTPSEAAPPPAAGGGQPPAPAPVVEPAGGGKLGSLAVTGRALSPWLFAAGVAIMLGGWLATRPRSS